MAQPWPAWVQTVKAAVAQAPRRSASSRMTKADLPPSSKKTFLRDSAAEVMTDRPVAVEPVKLIWSTRGSPDSRAPTVCSEDGTMLTTPGGMSVSSAMRRPSTVAHQGVSGAGLRTTVLPAARAGPSLAKLIWWGTFHGVMAPTTPVASRRTQRWDGMPMGAASPRSVSH